MSRQPSLINFATTQDQSMWGTGAAATINTSFYIVDPTTVGPVNLNENALNGLVNLSATASASFDLKAVLTGTSGSVSAKYPVNAYLDIPNYVQAGQSFTVGTSFFSASSVDLKTAFPGISLSLVADVNASLSGSLTTPLGQQTFNPTFDAHKELYKLDATNVSFSKSAGAFELKASLPDAFTTESTAVDNGGGLPTVTSTGSSKDVLSVSADLLKLLAPLVGLPPLSYDLQIGNTKYGEINLASLVLSGGIKIAQKFIFQPTAIDVTLDPGFGASKTGTLGDSFTFSVPNGYSGPVNLKATYSLKANLISDTGILGHVDAEFSAGKFKIQYYTGDSGTAKPLIDLGPVVDKKFDLVSGTPLYLYNPGTGPNGTDISPNNSFAFDSFNTVDQSYTIPLATVAQPHVLPNADVAFAGGNLSDPANWSPQTDPNNPQLPGPGASATLSGGTWSGSISISAAQLGFGVSATLVGSLTTTLYVDGNLTIDDINAMLAGSVSIALGGSVTLNHGTVSAAQAIATSGMGSFVQNGGTNSGGIVEIGSQSGTQGTYDLNGGSLQTVRLQIGEHGKGVFNQNGGDYSVSNAYIALGYNFDGDGSYNLEAGTFVASELDVGKEGAGAFSQSGGNASIPDVLIGLNGDGIYDLHHGSLTVSSLRLGGYAPIGTEDTGVGTFNFNMDPGDDATLVIGQGQSFAANGEFLIGDVGTGIFNQGGGNLTVPHSLALAAEAYPDSTSEGRYTLAAGTLNVTDEEKIGISGSGFFTQNGGSNSVPMLVMGVSTNLHGYGAYDLTGGTLSVAVSETVGSGGGGDFTQTGGSNSTGMLTVGGAGTEGGTYSLEAGTLSAGTEYIGYSSSGDFSQSGGSNTILGTGTVDPTGATLILGYQNISTGAPGSYTLGGTGSLSVIGGVIVGYFAADSYFGFNTEAGDAATLQISGPEGLTVGYDAGGATFIQGAGNLSIAALDVGTKSFVGEGDYELDGDPQKDSLTVSGTEIIGDKGVGTFEQEGAANTTADLILGNGSIAEGTYYLDAGTLSAGSEEIGLLGSGEFDQTGGSNSVTGDLVLGAPFAGFGTYRLGGDGTLDVTGAVTVDNGDFEFNLNPLDAATFTPGTHLVVVGKNANGNATFIEGGGDLQTTVIVGGNSGSNGTFEFNDGTLTAGDPLLGDGLIEVGASGQGTFTQTGLSTTVNGEFIVGAFVDGTGTYNLDSGVVTADSEIVGDGGTGTLNQTAGLNNPNGLTIGKQAGAKGTYNQTGGELTVNGDILLGVQAGAIGSLSLTNGAVVGNQLSLGQSGGTGSVIVGANSIFTVDSVATKGGTIDVLGGGSLGGGSLQVGTGATAILDSIHVGDAATFNGFGSIEGNLVNDGDVLVTGGLLAVSGAVTGTHAPKIDNGAVLAIGGLENGSILFAGGSGTTLKLYQPSQFGGVMEGLAIGNTIDLANKTVTTATIHLAGSGPSTLDVSTDTADTYSFKIAGDLTGNHFSIQTDNAGGSDLILSAGTAGGASSDFDGDGKTDILFSSSNSDYLWMMNDRAIGGQGGVDLYDGNFSVQVAGDFNGDGKSDVLFDNPTTGGVYEWQLDGTTILHQGAVDVGDPSYHILGTADFNGDGMSDVLWRSNAGVLYAWQMNGTHDTGAAVGPLDPSVWHAVGAGDFTGDGRADILLHYENGANAVDPSNGAFDIWEMDGSTITATLGVERPDPSWQILGVGDFNGDSISDIAIRNVSNTGDNGAVWIYLMAGTITSHPDTSKTADILAQGAAGIADAATWHVQEIGDLDGDGKDDILFRNDAGYFYSWDMNGTTIASEGAAGTQAGNWADPSLHVVGQHWDVA